MLQWPLFTDKKSSGLLTHGESDTQGAAASNSWAEIPSSESAGPWASEGRGTWGARLGPGGRGQGSASVLTCAKCSRPARGAASPKQAPRDHLYWCGVTLIFPRTVRPEAVSRGLVWEGSTVLSEAKLQPGEEGTPWSWGHSWVEPRMKSVRGEWGGAGKDGRDKGSLHWQSCGSHTGHSRCMTTLEGKYQN